MRANGKAIGGKRNGRRMGPSYTQAEDVLLEQRSVSL